MRRVRDLLIGRRRPPGSYAAARRRFAAVVVAVAGLATMPALLPYVGTGTDPSWSIALNMATSRHLAFGRDIVFTFGPLGFLASPGLSVARLGVAAMVLRFLLSGVLGWLVARSLLRSVWWPVAVALTWYLQWAVVGGSSGGAELVLVPVLLLAFGLLDALTVRNRPVGVAVLIGTGWVAATALLTKFDSGLLSGIVISGFLMAEKFVLRRSWRAFARSSAWAGAGFAVTLVAWWVLLGQRLSLLGRWLTSSYQIFRGYESAMVADSPLSYSPTHSVLTVAAVAVLAGLCAASAADRSRGVIVWVLSMCALAVYSKQSFTRYDDGHLQRLYVASALLLVAAAGLSGRRPVDGPDCADATAAPPGGHRPVREAAVLVAVAVAAYCAHVGAGLVGAARPSLTSSRDVARLALSPARRKAVIDRQRTLLPAELQIPPTVRAALSEGTVHVEPTETSIAWIFPEIRWKPLPVFQSYSAYTPELDAINADAYGRRGGPDLVLYDGGFRVDHRVARFESPAAQLAFVCNFRPRVLTDRWQVFVRRTRGSGCSQSGDPVATLTAHLGEKVVLPALPDDAVVIAQFSGLGPSAAQRLRSAVFRAPKFWFVLGAPDPGEPAHRFVTGTAGQPHIVSVPRCLRGTWSSYDTRTYSSFVVRDTEWPRADGATGDAYTVRLRAYRYECPA